MFNLNFITLSKRTVVETLGKLSRVALINFLFLAIGLLILELLSGNWLRSDRVNRLHLLKGVELKFDVDGLYPATDSQIIYKRDVYGFRGNYGKPDGIDILTVGGSTTDQRYITEGATWQDVLQHDFLSHGTRVSIANAGVDGQSTFGYIKDFDWWFPDIPNLRVKYFLFYIGINDVYKDEASKYDGFVRPSLTSNYFKQQIRENSALYHLYLSTTGIYEAEKNELRYRRVDFHTLNWVDRPAATNHEALMRARLRAYGERLRILDQRMHSYGTMPIYVTQPVRWCKNMDGKVIGVDEQSTFNGVSINGIDRCIMMQLINKKTMETCRDIGGICIDLASELEFDDSDFYDYHHNAPQGAEKIGHYLYQNLKQLFRDDPK